jgi:hypothetical protein
MYKLLRGIVFCTILLVCCEVGWFAGFRALVVRKKKNNFFVFFTVARSVAPSFLFPLAEGRFLL